MSHSTTSTVTHAKLLAAPTLRFTRTALHRRAALALSTELECSWIGICSEKDSTLIEDIIVPKQRNSSGSTEFSTADVMEIMDMAQIPIWRAVEWGHSHASHAVFFSSQDVSQASQLLGDVQWLTVINHATAKKILSGKPVGDKDMYVRLDVHINGLNASVGEWLSWEMDGANFTEHNDWAKAVSAEMFEQKVYTSTSVSTRVGSGAVVSDEYYHNWSARYQSASTVPRVMNYMEWAAVREKEGKTKSSSDYSAYRIQAMKDNTTEAATRATKTTDVSVVSRIRDVAGGYYQKTLPHTLIWWYASVHENLRLIHTTKSGADLVAAYRETRPARCALFEEGYIGIDELTDDKKTDLEIVAQVSNDLGVTISLNAEKGIYDVIWPQAGKDTMTRCYQYEGKWWLADTGAFLTSDVRDELRSFDSSCDNQHAELMKTKWYRRIMAEIMEWLCIDPSEVGDSATDIPETSAGNKVDDARAAFDQIDIDENMTFILG